MWQFHEIFVKVYYNRLQYFFFSSRDMAGSELSLNSLVVPTGNESSVHSYPTLTPTMSRKFDNPLTRAMGTLTRNPPSSSKKSRVSLGNLKSNWHYGSQSSLASSTLLRSSGIPENYGYSSKFTKNL